MNSALPLPALASPSTRAVEAPEPIPNVKHLQEGEKRQVKGGGGGVAKGYSQSSLIKLVVLTSGLNLLKLYSTIA